MSHYVKCVNNKTYFKEDLADHFADLVVGQVYKALPTDESERVVGMIRVIDGSGEDALYPVSYFEPFTINGNRVSEAITVYLDAYIKGVLHAEAVAAGKSISALVREWIEERLDLPANRDNDAQTADLVGHREA